MFSDLHQLRDIYGNHLYKKNLYRHRWFPISMGWFLKASIGWCPAWAPKATGEDSIEDSLSGAYGGLARSESTRSASYLGRDFFAVHVDPVWRLKGEPTLVKMGMVGELYNSITLSTCSLRFASCVFFSVYSPIQQTLVYKVQDWFGTLESMMHSLHHGGVY